MRCLEVGHEVTVKKSYKRQPSDFFSLSPYLSCPPPPCIKSMSTEPWAKIQWPAFCTAAAVVKDTAAARMKMQGSSLADVRAWKGEYIGKEKWFIASPIMSLLLVSSRRHYVRRGETRHTHTHTQRRLRKVAAIFEDMTSFKTTPSLNLLGLLCRRAVPIKNASPLLATRIKKLRKRSFLLIILRYTAAFFKNLK